MYRFPPPRLGSSGLEYVVAGTGRPAVVLVNGAGGPIEGWHRVFPRLAELTTVLAYNRCGIGRSAKPREPQTGRRMVAALRALLREAGIAPPWVLVGHSLGGLVVNLHARLHPDEVAGVVLLEATAPDDVDAFARLEGPLQRGLRRAIDAVFRPDANAETAHVATTVAEIAQAGPFPSCPLVVVTGGKPALAWAARAALAQRAANQRGLAALSPLGSHVIAARSGHFPQLGEPEVVVEAVRCVVASARETRLPLRDREMTRTLHSASSVDDPGPVTRAPGPPRRA